MIATWKDLCLDALDRVVMARFWAAATGLEVNASERHVSLDGPTPGHRVWVNQVDRGRSAKNRVHLDVYAASLDDLVGLGATVLSRAEETGFGWSVLADPEGGEFCAFLRDPGDLPSYRLHGVVIDCLDPGRVAGWWGEVLGVEPVHHAEHDWWTLERVAPDDTLTLDFVPVPEPRVAPNRVHWDVRGSVDDLLAAGATRLWDHEGSSMLADPEGNEFCVFAALPD
ncbi:MAG: hypothetical protein LH468_05905 [Nocardioides sp.]|nr:hypothetical protein [Nocardioides sp.]